MYLLDGGFGVFLDVFRHALLDGLLESVDGVAAGVAHGYLCVLGLGLALLDERFAAVFGERRYRQADNLAVVFGSDAYLGVCLLYTSPSPRD